MDHGRIRRLAPNLYRCLHVVHVRWKQQCFQHNRIQAFQLLVFDKFSYNHLKTPGHKAPAFFSRTQSVGSSGFQINRITYIRHRLIYYKDVLCYTSIYITLPLIHPANLALAVFLFQTFQDRKFFPNRLTPVCQRHLQMKLSYLFGQV